MESRFLSKFLLLMVLGLLAVGCGDGGDDAEPGPTLSAPAAVSGTILFSTTTPDGVVVEGTSFPLPSVLDLDVLVSWEGVTGDHEMEVRFFSPDGQLYLRRNVSFSSTSSMAAPKRTKAETGIPHLEGFATSNGQTTGVWISFPVGGTWITSHGLSGTWRVEALLDDGVSIASGTFALAP